MAIWAECLRIVKPGGHLLAFAGTRTITSLTINIGDAGFGDSRYGVIHSTTRNKTAQALIDSLTKEQLKLLDATFGRGWNAGLDVWISAFRNLTI